MDKLSIGIFDFELHRKNAIAEFTKIRQSHVAFSDTIQTILKKCLEDKNIKYHSIESRAKSIESFAEKACKATKDNPNVPKYVNPIKEITDLTAVRIITFFPITISEVNQVLADEFIILERSDKSEILEKNEKLGYKSVHYLIKLTISRGNLSEYKEFNGMIAEVQVRTILQHAWAEIEHDIEYKSVTVIPADIKRRFMALSGLLEIADREFESIQNDNETLKKVSRVSVNSGKFQGIEITKDSLGVYLDKKLGGNKIKKDDDLNYEVEASLLIEMGFKYLEQVNNCIKNYDCDKIHKLLSWDYKSQIDVLDDLIIAGMGEIFIKRHPYSKMAPKDSDYWIERWNEVLTKLRDAGIIIGDYLPENNLYSSGYNA
ncbi:GTP pyrophosphokinase [Clostridium estertheticum]|uniref:RelA/SpoT domain-containing protein n=1 Tax=Clostridium estertheticum TaxID=238834 RepID=A0AA47EJA8_9CLOT|nr:hypothetical protein [Clostridium estertheticum]MBU3155162.1 hypothetical protein [Clostridium estertheticum]WAG61216.1 hypothetical protein LL038_02905 [Clostridium estertheticum]